MKPAAPPSTAHEAHPAKEEHGAKEQHGAHKDNGGGVVIWLLFFFGMVFWALVSRYRRSQSGPFRILWVAVNGTPGRALVLSSSQGATGTTANGQRFQQRQMTLDIEIPGKAPYEVTGNVFLPRGLVEPIPGASLEVAIDPRSPARSDCIAVLGPGGFTGPWVRAGVPFMY